MRIDFYEMSGRYTDPLKVAAVLVSKAFPAHRDIVVVGPALKLAELDERLWKSPGGRFLPHGVDDPLAPIRLSQSAPQSAEIVINLDPATALPAGDYQRVLEIVPPDENARPLLRQRWSDYKAAGCEVNHHVLK